MRTLTQFVAMALVVAISAANSAADVIYINAAAAPGGDGTSWATAFNDLQDGLTAATPGSGDELWVVAGIYRPTGPGGDRAISFNLVSGAAIYGGFDGTETRLEQRDPAVNVTILSGDLNGNDVGSAIDATHTENSLHLVRASNTGTGTILDGVTITGGYADGVTPDSRGAGALLETAVVQIVNCTITTNGCRTGGCGVSVRNGGSVSITDSRIMHHRSLIHGQQDGMGLYAHTTTIAMTNCEVSHNVATSTTTAQGAGMVLWASNVNIRECLFEDNHGKQGGALQLSNEGGLPQSTGMVSKCRFIGNAATSAAGGLVNFTSVSIVDCQFIGNHSNAGGAAAAVGNGKFINCLFAENTGGAGGGMFIQNGIPQLINCVFTGNTATNGGAIWGFAELGLLQNCTIANNTATNSCGGVSMVSPITILENCIVWGNSDSNGNGQASQLSSIPTVNYSCIQGWTGSLNGIGSFGLDPQFVDADGDDNIPGTEDDNFRLAAGSPCINRGDPIFVPSHPVDFDNQPRIQECLVDLGAYETADADPLLPDCNNNGVQDACDIADRTSIDCNLNIVPDECDIAGGTSADKNGNGVPDECDDCPADVNDNGIVTIADLLLVISNWGQTGANPADVNGDGIVNITDLLAVIAAWGPC